MAIGPLHNTTEHCITDARLGRTAPGSNALPTLSGRYCIVQLQLYIRCIQVRGLCSLVELQATALGLRTCRHTRGCTTALSAQQIGKAGGLMLLLLSQETETHNSIQDLHRDRARQEDCASHVGQLKPVEQPIIVLPGGCLLHILIEIFNLGYKFQSDSIANLHERACVSGVGMLLASTREVLFPFLSSSSTSSFHSLRLTAVGPLTCATHTNVHTA